MADIRNPIVSLVAAQWMPAIEPDGAGNCTLDCRLWSGVPSAWATSSAQSITITTSMLRAIGAAIALVIGGAGTQTVGASPECLVSAVTVSGRANIGLQFRDGAHANIGSRIDLDNVRVTALQMYTAFLVLEASAGAPLDGTAILPSYAERCGVEFAAVRP